MQPTMNALAQSLQPPELSIVVPAHNEQGNLRPLSFELRNALSPLAGSWELIFVDDGSTDDTWSQIRSLHEEDGRIRGIRLSRNFGHQGALMAGMTHARGDAVISMDADLQHPPAVVPLLVAEWRKGNKIVKTVRRDPADLPVFKRLTSSLFYRFFSYLSGVDLKSGMADFRLLDREVLREILAFREEGLFLRGIVQWVGYPNSTVDFDCGTRLSGSTKYTFRRMVRFAWHGVSSFSLVPLRIGILVGLTASTVAFLGVAYAMLAKWLDGHTVAGWASSVAIISFLFGVLFLFLAILAEYVGRILEEVRGRPRFIVSERLDTGPASADSTSTTATRTAVSAWR
jgi:dolichol-phosphate mannosyltransferase